VPARPLSARAALLFLVIGIAIYGAVFWWSERLVIRTGHINPFFKITTAESLNLDWVILGASHAMPLDYADFNQFMERETGARIMNLAATGAGPLYNRFILEHFLAEGGAADVLYIADSFAFRSPEWNEHRFADAKLIRGTPLDLGIARRLAGYVSGEGVAPGALADYVTGFSKINNRDRFKQDTWEGEAQFERVFRPSTSADARRIEYLFPDGADDDATLERYLSELHAMIEIARDSGAGFTIIKPPVPEQFQRLLPGEERFDAAMGHLAAQTGVEFRDFSTFLGDPSFYSDTDHLNRDGVTRFFKEELRPILAGAVAGHQ
jgi:hypothetical protein